MAHAQPVHTHGLAGAAATSWSVKDDEHTSRVRQALEPTASPHQ
jgi:hypothetical protein